VEEHVRGGIGLHRSGSITITANGAKENHLQFRSLMGLSLSGAANLPSEFAGTTA